jgi:hypothetical protein
MWDWLSHPLVVLTVGAALTGLLIPQLTQRWQDQRKALEIKAELIERVSRAVAEIFTAAQLASVGAASQTQDDFDDAYKAWIREKVILTSLLRGYFGDDRIDRAWSGCRGCAGAYYVQIGIRRDSPEETSRARTRYLRTVAAGLALDPPQDLSEDAFLVEDVPDSGTAQIEDVLHLRTEVWRRLDVTVAAIRGGRIRF